MMAGSAVEHLNQDAPVGAAGPLDAEQCGECRRDVGGRDVGVVGARPDARAHEDDRHMGVVVVGRAVRVGVGVARRPSTEYRQRAAGSSRSQRVAQRRRESRREGSARGCTRDRCCRRRPAASAAVCSTSAGSRCNSAMSPEIEIERRFTRIEQPARASVARLKGEFDGGGGCA